MFGNKDLLRRVTVLEGEASTRAEIFKRLQSDIGSLTQQVEGLTTRVGLLVEYVDKKLLELLELYKLVMQQLEEIDASHPQLIQELTDRVKELRMDVNSYRLELQAPALSKHVPAATEVPVPEPSLLSELRSEPQSPRVEAMKDEILAWLRTSYGVKREPVEVDFDTEVAAQSFRLSERRFREYLNMLSQEGVIEPIGRGRSHLPTYSRIRIHPARATR